MTDSVGVVIIGRNEGERLKRCFASINKHVNQVVYVDSGSTDDSVSYAKSIGIIVLNLDMSKPFTAARARNAGFNKLEEIISDIKYVQFVDGDCEISEGWLTTAEEYLRNNKTYAITCGRLREKYPDRSVYNRLCDIEWNGPIGEISECGGIFMIRQSAYKEVKGMNPAIIAGEEPELCLRLRMKNWKISRLDHDMGWHDANMTKFSQWWKRSVRTGYAYALGKSLHGKTEYRHYVQQTKSIILWSVIIPIFIIGIAIVTKFLGLILLGIYPLMFLRVYLKLRKGNKTHSDALIFSTNCIIAKFPQMIGFLKYKKHILFSQQSKIIEYK